MTVKEACEELQVSRPTLYSIIKSGALSAYRVGKVWRVDNEDISQFKKNKGSVTQIEKEIVNRGQSNNYSLACANQDEYNVIAKYLAQLRAGADHTHCPACGCRCLKADDLLSEDVALEPAKAATDFHSEAEEWA